MSIIETKNLTKQYLRFQKAPGLLNSVKSLFHREFIQKTAVSEFDLSIGEGEFVGLIGPNGAGKTTLIKMLTGIIPPTSGELSVLGHTPNRLEEAFKRQIAVVMGQKSQLFMELTPADTLLLFKEMYGMSESAYRKSVDYFIDLFDVSSLLNVQVRTLSLGERMKMELIVALLHHPRVLFLDEPTIGLDAMAQRQMREFLRRVNLDQRTTILLTSHYMEDIQSLCPRCAVIAGGVKLYDGSLETLLSRYQQKKRVTIRYTSPYDPVLPEDVAVIEQSAFRLELLAPHDGVQRLLGRLIAQGDISDISVEEEDIGIVVERIYAARKEAAR